MAAWGSSLLRWLTGQFSAVLRRAERCKTELRGSVPTAEAAAAAAAATCAVAEGQPAASCSRTKAASPAPDARGRDAGAVVASSSSSSAGGGGALPGGNTAVANSPAEAAHSRAAGVTDGTIMGGAAGASGLEGALVTASPERSSALVSAGAGGGGGPGLAPPAERHGHGHGAAPAAVAVSARDIVVRSALAMAKESAASEVLGMWEPARRGYEKVYNRREAVSVFRGGERSLLFGSKQEAISMFNHCAALIHFSPCLELTPVGALPFFFFPVPPFPRTLFFFEGCPPAGNPSPRRVGGKARGRRHWPRSQRRWR